MQLMNKLFFKACLKSEEYECFKHVRNILTGEFHVDGVKLLDALDDIHILFLHGEPHLISNQVVNFRDIAFELINRKV